MFTLFLIFFCLIQNAESSVNMKPPYFEKVSYKKTSCSPENPSSKDGILLFNMPKEINWGEEIPICGLIKGLQKLPSKDNLPSFQIEIRDQKNEDFIHENANFELGEPKIGSDPAFFTLLSREGKVYFNARVKNEFTVLAPGDYFFSLAYFGVESKRMKLKVVPSGWRLEIANFLGQKFCKGNILEDLKEFLAIENKLSVVDILNEKAYAEILKKRQSIGKKEFKKYLNELDPDWKKGIANESNVDLTVINFTMELLKQNCPNKSEAHSQIHSIYSGLKEFIKLNLKKPKD